MTNCPICGYSELGEKNMPLKFMYKNVEINIFQKVAFYCSKCNEGFLSSTELTELTNKMNEEKTKLKKAEK